jgi:hypothetical protein
MTKILPVLAAYGALAGSYDMVGRKMPKPLRLQHSRHQGTREQQRRLKQLKSKS